MNDDFEHKLRSLKPGTLPPDFAALLEHPPALPPSRRPRVIVWLSLAAAAAAACVMLLLSSGNSPVPPVTAAAPRFAGESAAPRVTTVRPVSVITDAAQRHWKLLEVDWVEEDTIVFASQPVTVHLQDRHRAIVPVPVYYD